MMTNEERIQAIEGFGYTDCEATSLCLAALHSGYFLRAANIDGLSMRAAATEYASSEKTIAYHPCSWVFDSAIGELHNRHRRERRPFAVKAKLMSLDYVLANPNHRYLATEEEKVGI